MNPKSKAAVTSNKNLCFIDKQGIFK